MAKTGMEMMLSLLGINADEMRTHVANVMQIIRQAETGMNAIVNNQRVLHEQNKIILAQQVQILHEMRLMRGDDDSPKPNGKDSEHEQKQIGHG